MKDEERLGIIQSRLVSTLKLALDQELLRKQHETKVPTNSILELIKVKRNYQCLSTYLSKNK